MADEVRVTVDSQERRALLVSQGGTGTSSGQVQGAAADNAAPSGNPVLVAGRHQVTSDTRSDGDVATVAMDSFGRPIVKLSAMQGAATDSISSGICMVEDATIATHATGRLLGTAQFGFNGTAYDRLRANTTGLITIKPQGWVYAGPTGGIDNSATAVTIKAAAGANVRNYLTSLQIDNDVLGAVTEIAIRDGAGGTVLWRGKLQTAAGSRSIVFDNPLFSTANTLLEFLTVTAVTGDVIVSAQGYTAP